MKFTFKHIILFTLITVLCCSSTMTLKEKPQGHDWLKCPSCKGYGEIEIIEENNSSEIISFENKKNYRDSQTGCLSIPFKSQDAINNKLNAQYKQEIESKNIVDDIPQKSYTKKRIICPRCNGKGWVKVTPLKEKKYDFLRYDDEIYKKLNKQINKPIKK